MTDFGKKIVHELFELRHDLHLRSVSEQYWLDRRLATEKTLYRIMANSIQLFDVEPKHTIIIKSFEFDKPIITMAGINSNYNGRIFTIPLDIKTEEQYFQMSLLYDISRLDLDDIIMINEHRISSHILHKQYLETYEYSRTY